MTVNIDKPKITLLVQCRCCGRVCEGSWLGRSIPRDELAAMILMNYTRSYNYCSKLCYDKHCAEGTLPIIRYHNSYFQLLVSGDESCIRCLHRLHYAFRRPQDTASIVFTIVTGD